MTMLSPRDDIMAKIGSQVFERAVEGNLHRPGQASRQVREWAPKPLAPFSPILSAGPRVSIGFREEKDVGAGTPQSLALCAESAIRS